MIPATLPNTSMENWKYSPVRMLPENYDAIKQSKMVSVKKGEKTSLLTEYTTGSEFNRSVIEITIAENAELSHWLMFDESSEVAHVDEIKVSVGRNARYVLNAVTIGSRWSRSDIHIRLAGEGASCALFGLDLAGENAVVDRHVYVEHLVPHTNSDQLFKGVFDQSATSSFFGKIKVVQGADGTKANQTNRNLLLSQDATVNARPQLEIDTDEVSCTHGATVGQLDEEAIFYLRARGLSEQAARNFLVQAFAKEVLDAFGESEHRIKFENRVNQWFAEKTHA